MYYLLHRKDTNVYAVVSPTKGYSTPGWTTELNKLQNDFNNFNNNNLPLPTTFKTILSTLQREANENIELLSKHRTFSSLMKLHPELLI